MSLVEMLIVLSILTILMAFLNPVFVSAKRASQISATKQNLRQQWLAIKLYQDEYGGDGQWGTAADMNLPDIFVMAKKMPYLNLSVSAWRSPCGRHPLWPTEESYSYRIYPDSTNDHRTRNGALLYQDNLVVSTDPNCNDSAVNLDSNWENRLGIGILLSGQLIQKRQRGDWYDYGWWAPPTF